MQPSINLRAKQLVQQLLNRCIQRHLQLRKLLASVSD